MKPCRARGFSCVCDRDSVTSVCECPYLCAMKAYLKKVEEKEECRTVEPNKIVHKIQEFCTGSSYEGEWRNGFSMHGYGVYTFPNGVIYEGEFEDGWMHGKGELRYITDSCTVAIRGLWKYGEITERKVVFHDALEFDETDWKYCKMPDRRFALEFAKGMMPAGRSYMTARQPTLEVPVGYYDTDDGFYDIKRRVVYDHDDITRSIRGPSFPERKWIKENCRIGHENLNIGPRPDLYETFIEPTALLEKEKEPAANTVIQLRSELAEDTEWEAQNDIHDVIENKLVKLPPELLLK